MISRDFYKKPVFYYILIPACLALWPCLVAFFYLPNSKKAFEKEQQIYSEANSVMLDILSIDDRSKSPASANPVKGFDYYTALTDAARSSGISNPSIKSDPIRSIENKKIQESTVTLPGTGIGSFANFLFYLQRRWASLECENIQLDKQKGLPDVWKITVRFRYHF